MSAPSEEIVLRGGYAGHEGTIHSEVVLEALDGAAEEALVDAPAGACAARILTLLLTNSVRRIGGIREITPELVKDLLVEDREYLAMRLREKTLGPQMWIAIHCPHPECCEAMEIKLVLDELTFERRPVAARFFALEPGSAFRFRLPTGGDQELAASSGLQDPVALRDFMLARCLDRSAEEIALIDPAVKDAIELRMEQLAPDVTPELDATCPVCNRPFTARVDLGFLAMRELKSHAYRLEQEVHLLAWNYKWSEREILALPRRKRERYVQMVEDELEMRASV